MKFYTTFLINIFPCFYSYDQECQQLQEWQWFSCSSNIVLQCQPCSVSWGCRIHWLHLCREVRPHPNKCPGYDTKQSNAEVPVMLELWGMRSTSSLPSLPDPLWPWMLAPDRVLSMSYMYQSCYEPICYNNTLSTVCPVGWGCRIHRLHICRGVRPSPMSVLDMTLNNLMVRFLWCWSFGGCGAPLYCHRSQVHTAPEW